MRRLAAAAVTSGHGLAKAAAMEAMEMKRSGRSRIFISSLLLRSDSDDVRSDLGEAREHSRVVAGDHTRWRSSEVEHAPLRRQIHVAVERLRDGQPFIEVLVEVRVVGRDHHDAVARGHRYVLRR